MRKIKEHLQLSLVFVIDITLTITLFPFLSFFQLYGKHICVVVQLDFTIIVCFSFSNGVCLVYNFLSIRRCISVNYKERIYSKNMVQKRIVLFFDLCRRQFFIDSGFVYILKIFKTKKERWNRLIRNGYLSFFLRVYC